MTVPTQEPIVSEPQPVWVVYTQVQGHKPVEVATSAHRIHAEDIASAIRDTRPGANVTVKQEYRSEP